jgi:hypothetical protein
MAFEVRIPTGKGKGSKADEIGGVKQSNILLKKLDKSILKTVDVGELLMQFAGDTLKLLSPLIKLLSLLVMVIFLPLMPVIKFLSKAIAGLIKIFTGGFGNIAEMIGKLLLGILILVLLAFVSGIMLTIGLVLLAAFLLWDAFVILWEYIKIGGKMLWEFLVGIWDDYLKPAFLYGVEVIKWFFNLWVSMWKGIFEYIKNFGVWIWDIFVKGLEFIGNLGSMIWNLLKVGFDFVVQGLKNVINGIITMANILPGVTIPYLAEGGIVTKPTLAIIGESGPEAVIPLGRGMGGNTFNIYNPTIRDDSDIRKLANEVSRRLQLNAIRGFS